MTPILGEARANSTTAIKWARQRGCTDWFATAVRHLYVYGPERGVRPEVAVAQAYHETAGGRFGGVLDATYNNTCGLKKTHGGGDHDPKAHMKFPTLEMGAIAHLDHLASYASSPGYPKTESPDPRNTLVYGYGATVEAMGKQWATGGYGPAVLKLLALLVTTK